MLLLKLWFIYNIAVNIEPQGSGRIQNTNLKYFVPFHFLPIGYFEAIQ